MKCVGAKVELVFQHEDGRLETQVVFNKVDPTGLYLKTSTTFKRPIEPVYEDPFGPAVGYQQKGPIVFELKVEDRASDGKVF